MNTYIGKAAWAPVDTLGHELVYVDPVAKTCVEDGTLGYYYCADCGKKFSDETATTIIADEDLIDKATGSHTYAVVVTKATPTTSGKAEKKCTVCGDVAAKTTLYKASKVSLSKTSFTYNGKVQVPTVTVNDSKNNAISTSYYTISYSNKSSKSVGTYTVTVKFKGRYSGSTKLTYKIVKAANPITVKTKNASVKYSDLSKKNQTIAKASVFTVSKNKGTVTYKKTSGNSKITVASNGKITVKKGLAKGTYTIKVQVKAAGNSGYKAGTKTVSFKITVK